MDLNRSLPTAGNQCELRCLTPALLVTALETHSTVERAFGRRIPHRQAIAAHLK